MIYVELMECILLAVLFAVVLRRWTKAGSKGKQLPLPPGPRTLPFLGNYFDLPDGEKDWVTYKAWGKTYGDVCSVSVGGQTIVVLNSAQAAVDLMVMRSSIYSDRPTLVFGGEMCGWINSTALAPYGDVWRGHRRVMHQFMGTQNMIKPFLPPMREAAHKLVLSILENPSPLELENHIRRAVGSVIFKLVYGYTVVSTGQDPFIHLTDIAMQQFSKCCEPATYLVDAFPFLRHMPNWIPGSAFKRTAQHFWSTLQQFAQDPFQFTKKQMEIGTAVPSFISQQLEKMDPELHQHAELDIIKWAGASMVAGGTEALVSMELIFFLAMAKYQNVQHKAQREIHAVIGSNRLPKFEDLHDLPYVHAIMKETLRWQAVAPSIIRRVMEDDTYRGWRIPKGSVILANVWNIMHDEKVYTNPYTFNPDRFLGLAPDRDPADFVFGYGRRLCPGNLFAEQSLFMTMATVLATLNIRKPHNGQGIEVKPIMEEVSGLISRPKPFLCVLKPRHLCVEALLRNSE
ncbi:hypothetical protein PILCRDRAFT_574370 [Piloderma croceum F 1598]|uniref:Cytochrome P450 n=1 Tax=Piloderma croceum (strain F 1598) TaxID=765440 RepID=A0A0C3FGR7_PILCF|nr:hypothetical protein PILCRDRAFT_574370 [Piloderma croceum F 1598]